MQDLARRLREPRLAFILMLVVLVAGIALAPVVLIRPIIDATAWVTATLVGTTGTDATLDGNTVFLPSRTLLITRDCTGLYLIAAFTALVLTYPARKSQKLLALAAGIPLLLALNVGRLVGAGVVAESMPGSFELLHDYVFQVGLVLVVLGLWFLWTTRVKARDSRDAER